MPNTIQEEAALCAAVFEPFRVEDHSIVDIILCNLIDGDFVDCHRAPHAFQVWKDSENVQDAQQAYIDWTEQSRV